MITSVLMVQFTSTNFNGSEVSGEVLITLALSGVSTSDIDVQINLYGINATGYLLSIIIAIYIYIAMFIEDKSS